VFPNKEMLIAPSSEIGVSVVGDMPLYKAVFIALVCSLTGKRISGVVSAGLLDERLANLSLLCTGKLQ
jgi:hypothetical protein